MTTALTPEIVTPATENLPAPAERVGGLNENQHDNLEGVVRRIGGLDREDYAIPLHRLVATAGTDGVSLGSRDGSHNWRAISYALDQLGGSLARGLSTFGKDMRSRGSAELYADTVNGLLTREEYAEKRFQLRTIQPNGERIARAVVSTAYKPIDDDLIVPPMLDKIADNGNWRALGGQLTDRRTHIRFINREPSITGIGPNNRDWFIDFEYSNSEVGSGKCRFALFFYDGYCGNGCVFGRKSIADVDFVHIGAQIETHFGLVVDERARETEQASIRRLILEATQTVLAGGFSRTVREHLERSQARKLEGNTAEAIKRIAKTVGLNKGEQEAVLTHWDSKEDNLLGVHSAITRLAQDADSFDKRVELESAGGKALELTNRQWESVLALSA